MPNTFFKAEDTAEIMPFYTIKAEAFKTHQGGAFSWQNAIFATKVLPLESRFLTLTEDLTEPGSPTL